MSNGALIMMITCYSVIISMAGYFFFRVLTAKPKPEEDSYTDNDPEKDAAGKT